MSVSDEWYEYRESLTTRMRAEVGGWLGSEVILEQMLLRSRKERRCVECGEAGTVIHTSKWIQAVDHYFLCDECDAYFEGSVGGERYTVLGRSGKFWAKVEGGNNRRAAQKIARHFATEARVRCNVAA